MSRAKLHQSESTLTVNGVTVPITLDVSYIWSPNDSGIGHQPEILDVRVKDTYSILHILPVEIIHAIISEIVGAQ